MSKNAVTGIDTSKLDRTSMIEVFRKLGESVPDNVTAESLSVRLHARYSTLPAADLCECDNCGGRSPCALSACPYCGMWDETDLDSKEEEKDTMATVVLADATADTTPKAPRAPKEKAPKAPKAPKVEKAETTVKTPKAPRAPKGEKAPKIENITRGSGKKSIAEVLAEAAGTSPKVKDLPVTASPKGFAALVAVKKPFEMADSRFSEKDLDDAVVRVKSKKEDGAVALWSLGQEIKIIYDERLWTLRANDGKPKYKNAEQFFNNELGMTPRNAYALMDIASRFSEEKVRKFGTTKLDLLLKAPEEERGKLEENLDRMSTKSLREKVKDLNSGKTEIVTRQGVVKSKPEVKTKGVDPNLITVANIVGKQSAVLYCRPSNPFDLTEKEIRELPKATKVSDNPWTRIELENGVYQYFSVLESSDGSLRLNIVTQRSDGEIPSAVTLAS